MGGGRACRHWMHNRLLLRHRKIVCAGLEMEDEREREEGGGLFCKKNGAGGGGIYCTASVD